MHSNPEKSNFCAEQSSGNKCQSNNSTGPILITGAHRSGTTWVGKALKAAPGVSMIYEPFNCQCRKGICSAGWPAWYMHVHKGNEESFQGPLQDTLAYRYNFREGLRNVANAKDVAHCVRDYSVFTYSRFTSKRPIVKDPIALLSAEWLVDQFDMQVLLMVRHPVAFICSLRERDWRFDFSNFTKQSALMDGLLKGFRKEIEQAALVPPSFIVHAALLWKILYTVIEKYRARHPGWLVVRHEDLAINPQGMFPKIFESLGLKYTQSSRRQVLKITDGAMPYRGRNGGVHQLKRNSKMVATQWKGRLSIEDICIVKEIVWEVFLEFYEEHDWEGEAWG